MRPLFEVLAFVAFLLALSLLYVVIRALPVDKPRAIEMPAPSPTVKPNPVIYV